MTWLQKLEAIFGSRTKGDWRYATCWGVATIESDSGDIAHAVDYLTPDNATFISTAGTLGDELLAVVKAANDVYTYDDFETTDSIRLYNNAMLDMGDALAALRAKVEGV